jgi:hypothetical protein
MSYSSTIPTKKKQASKAIEKPLTIKKPKLGSSDSQVCFFFTATVFKPLISPLLIISLQPRNL